MVGELGEAGVEISGVAVFDDRRGAAMQRCSGVSRQARVHGVAQKCVRERVPAIDGGLVDESRRYGGAETFTGLGSRNRADVRQHLDVELEPDDRRRGEELMRGLRQSRDPPLEHRPHACRDDVVGQRRALRLRETHHLAHEQRVTAGASVQVGH